LGQHASVGQLQAVETQAQQLGKARLTGSVKTRNPSARLSTAGLPFFKFLSDAREQPHELLVNAVLVGAGVPAGVTTRDDVLADLVGDLRRILLVKVDDRIDVSG